MTRYLLALALLASPAVGQIGQVSGPTGAGTSPPLMILLREAPASGARYVSPSVPVMLLWPDQHGDIRVGRSMFASTTIPPGGEEFGTLPLITPAIQVGHINWGKESWIESSWSHDGTPIVAHTDTEPNGDPDDWINDHGSKVSGLLGAFNPDSTYNSGAGGGPGGGDDELVISFTSHGGLVTHTIKSYKKDNETQEQFIDRHDGLFELAWAKWGPDSGNAWLWDEKRPRRLVA